MRNIKLPAEMLAIALIVCVYPAQAFALWGLTTRASLGPGSLQADSYSDSPAISADGRYVAFASAATNLVTGETGGQHCVFRRDRTTGVTTRVSAGPLGVQPNDVCWDPCISADGRHVAFYSNATNLVANDTNGQADIFVRDTASGVTTLASVNTAGEQANGSSSGPAISADGRYVAFASDSPNLVISDTNAHVDVFVHDRLTGVTTRESMGPAAQGNGDSTAPSISADGRYVAFESLATDFAASDSNGASDVFVRDRVAGTTARMSMDSSAVPTNGGSHAAAISQDGRCVAFESTATNLVAGDSNGASDVFVRDRVANTTTRVSVDSAGVQGNANSDAPAISGDGRRVAFESIASNFTPGDDPFSQDIFIRDLLAGATTLASQSSSGLRGNTTSAGPCVSGDGRYVAFDSSAANLVPSDTNLSADVFVREAPALTTSITIKATATTTYAGKTPVLSGAVTPSSMIGVNIVCYVMKPGKTYWTYSSNRTVYNLNGSPAWQYKYYFKPGMARGYYKFKAVAPAPGFASSAGFATSTSPMTVTIRVK